MNWWGFVASAFGALWLSAAVFNWQWFWKRNKPRLDAERFGPEAARALYGVIGVAVIVMGILLATRIGRHK